jgi:hypothetical protein
MLGCWVRGEGMKIGDKKIGVVMMLHLDEIFYCSKIITEMKVSC